MDITSIRNQFIILLNVLQQARREALKILSGISPTGWSVTFATLIGAAVCFWLYMHDKKRAAARGIPVTVCAIFVILFVSRLLSVLQAAGVTDVGLFVVIWAAHRPVALFNSEGKRIGGVYIRHGQADITSAKRKVATVTVVIRKEYAHRHIGETIRFIAGGQTIGCVKIPSGAGKARAQI